jgi:sRNA-binding protein
LGLFPKEIHESAYAGRPAADLVRHWLSINIDRRGISMSGKGSRKRYNQNRRRREHAETLHGMKEARAGIARLQCLWPAAFPVKGHLVKPLASGTVRRIANTAGWSWGYTRGVVKAWKTRSSYCDAVLRYDRRFDLNGDAVDEAVSEHSKEQARQVLAARAARMRARDGEAAANNRATSSPEPAGAASHD